MATIKPILERQTVAIVLFIEFRAYTHSRAATYSNRLFHTHRGFLTLFPAAAGAQRESFMKLIGSYENVKLEFRLATWSVKREILNSSLFLLLLAVTDNFIPCGCAPKTEWYMPRKQHPFIRLTAHCQLVRGVQTCNTSARF